MVSLVLVVMSDTIFLDSRGVSLPSSPRLLMIVT